MPQGFVDAFGQALGDDSVEPALRAEVLRLPGESYLADLMETVDVDAMHDARERVRAHLSSALHDALIRIYAGHQTEGGFDAGAAAIGRRSLKNLALSYLSAGATDQAEQLCVEQYLAPAQHDRCDRRPGADRRR